MPDALSKTVPIWCCVINRAVFGRDHKMYTPPQAVSESEHAQIDGRIDGFVKQFLVSYEPYGLSQVKRLIVKGYMQTKNTGATGEITETSEANMGHTAVIFT